ncbi:uncharacterized protein LOC127136852 [Lathyrus oleraceus]|uniref:uncharacterized protein LOC127136852 n=1 Tax=Pisum sativum TaxID=3888 RepID=UPI0021D39441|nr:uncharacterized protein LOC127136852 [Pisum sativum]
MEAWNRLEDIFQDNQNARVITLKQEFSNTRMEYFPNVSAYCQCLKMLSDQLRNVDFPVNTHHLVLQPISGLPEAYRSVSTFILQSNPLLAFYQARSMLTLEEAGIAKMENTGSHAAMHNTQTKPTKDTSQRGNRRPDNRSRSRGNQGRGGGRGNRNAPQSGALSAPSHCLILLGNSNNSTQPSNHGVGLHHHGLCHRVRIPPLSGHALPVLLSSQAF